MLSTIFLIEAICLMSVFTKLLMDFLPSLIWMELALLEQFYKTFYGHKLQIFIIS